MESTKNISMSQEEFYNFIKESVQGFFPDSKVEIRKVEKSMDDLDGLMVRMPDSNIAPTIYLNTAWEKFCETGKDGACLMEIAKDIAKTVESGLKRSFEVTDVIKDIKENWQSKVYCSLVPGKDNDAFLKKGIYDKFLDMAKVYYINYFKEEDSTGRIRVDKSLLHELGCTEKELKQVAMENTKNQTYCCKSMLDTLAEMMCWTEEEVAAMKAQSDIGEQMFVLNNESKMDGAAAILFDENIRNVLEKEGLDGCFVLPSSRHEVLLIPMESGRNVDELRKMVKEVNDTQVAPEDLLSYSVYFFDKEKGLMQCKRGFYIDEKGGHNKEDENVDR